MKNWFSLANMLSFHCLVYRKFHFRNAQRKWVIVDLQNVLKLSLKNDLKVLNARWQMCRG